MATSKQWLLFNKMCTAVIIAKLTFKIRTKHNWRCCISKSLKQELWGLVAIYHLKLPALEPDWWVNVRKMLFLSWYTKAIQWPADSHGFTTGSIWVCTTDTPFLALLWISYAFNYAQTQNYWGSSFQDIPASGLRNPNFDMWMRFWFLFSTQALGTLPYRST